MNITEFFQQSAGKWFSQRTNHHLAANQSEGDKSNLTVELLASDDPALTQLCQQYDHDPAQACGMRVTREAAMTLEKQAPVSTVVVAIANPDNASEGTLLRAAQSGAAPAIGRYIIGQDDALTLITESGSLYAEERLWYASSNLRLRTNLIKQSGTVSVATFCSEIRMGAVQPASPTATAGNTTSSSQPSSSA
jgi:hypothetical protein